MLKELQDLLADSEEVELTGGDFEDIPDGTYSAIVESTEFTESKAGNLMFVFEFVLDNGRHFWKHQVLNSPENMKRLTTDLAKFGVDTSGIDTIEADIDDLVIGAQVELTIKTNVSKSGKFKGQSFQNSSIKVI